MPKEKGNAEESGLPSEGSTAAVGEAVRRYAEGVITPDDDDSHLSDLAYLTTSGVRDPNDVVAGVYIKK